MHTSQEKGSAMEAPTYPQRGTKTKDARTLMMSSMVLEISGIVL